MSYSNAPQRVTQNSNKGRNKNTPEGAHMGATKKTLKARKATFTRESVKGVDKFTPVNRHAKLAAALMGKKTAKLEITDLKNVKKAGLRVYEYVEGELKAVKL